MKRILFLAVVLLLAASCSVTRDRMTVVGYADYTVYPDMWISPNTCTIPHKALGELSIDIRPAIGHTNTKNADGVYTNNIGRYQAERLHGDELLDIAVKEAKARGANGISNLSMRVEGSQTGEPTSYHITGLLIRVE